KTAKAEIPQFPVGEKFSQPGKEGKAMQGKDRLGRNTGQRALVAGVKKYRHPLQRTGEYTNGDRVPLSPR
ncbi:MAG: hypothetical protein ACRDDF_03405, partial [Aeromonas sp.]